MDEGDTEPDDETELVRTQECAHHAINRDSHDVNGPMLQGIRSAFLQTRLIVHDVRFGLGSAAAMRAARHFRGLRLLIVRLRS
jgi:hypothetical protein